MITCHVCKKELVIQLYPDYASSGMWCKACGVNFANPKKTFKRIPLGLSSLVIVWNDYWEDTASRLKEDSDMFFIDRIQEEFDLAGYYLAEMIGAYYPCEYAKENSKIKWIGR